MAETTATTNLNFVNYLNLVGYIVNAFVTFAASPIFGFPSNAKLSEKYQTLVTPFGAAFGIWSVIFIMQAIFVIYQMLERYRGDKLVQEGVSYWYFIACMCQCGWTFAFGYEAIPVSALMMVGILVSLAMIVNQQNQLEPSSEHGLQEFWILKFPFSIHCGWIAAAFAINMNVLVLDLGASAGPQVACAYLTLAFAGLVAIFVLAYLSPPDFTIPLVLLWATIGIAVELNDPLDKIKDLFGEETIAMFRGWTLATSMILGVATVGYGVLVILKKKDGAPELYRRLEHDEN